MNARAFSLWLFRIVYGSSYTILYIGVLLLLAITPGDLIYQTVNNHKVGNVFVVGGVYVVTAAVALFIYASRLYTNRAALAAIPKPYLPVEDGEVSKRVRKMIVRNRQRSALISWETRPRDLAPELLPTDPDGDEKPSLPRVTTKRKNHKADAPITIDPLAPPWGNIIHAGWSSPSCTDFPDLQFDTVVAELPNLIEAKAVSLAPTDPAFDFLSARQGTVNAPPDPAVVALLQRARAMGLRDYIDYLVELGVVRPPELAQTFVAHYEYARFSGRLLLEGQFRTLMAVFSDVLVGMTQIDPAVLEDSRSSRSGEAASLRSFSSQDSVVRRPRTISLRPSPSEASVASAQSVMRHPVVEGAG